MGVQAFEEAIWSFDEIAALDPDRASRLESAGSPSVLVDALKDKLRSGSVTSHGLRFGREHLNTDWECVRAVVQFSVGEKLFDWFFNAWAGYRAHFFAHYKCGLRFNNLLVESLVSVLEANVPGQIVCREIGKEFSDCGETLVPKTFLISSLRPYLTKIWKCDSRIAIGKGADHLLPGVTGPKLLLREGQKWAALYRSDDEAWLEFKGAFLGRVRPFQSKPAIGRARKLQNSGEA